MSLHCSSGNLKPQTSNLKPIYPLNLNLNLKLNLTLAYSPFFP